MSLAKLFVEVGADVNNFDRGMKHVRSDIDRTANHASMFSNTLSTALGTGLTMVTAKVASTFSDTISWIKKTGEEFNSLKENSTLAFTTMLGSAEQAQSFLKDLQKFAERTPFELPGLIDASQKMIAFGFTAQSVIPTLTAIGDAVSGLGGSPEKLQRVITAIGQIQAKGKVQAQEMLQLAEAGIPAWDMLAKAIGKTIPEAMKMSENGAIDAATAINALINGMNDRFGGLMEKQSKSFTGLKSTFNDLLRDVAARLTKPWFDNAKRGLERMIALMQSDAFKSFMEKAVKQSERLANFIGKVQQSIFDFVINGGKSLSGLFSGGFNVFDALPKKLQNVLGYLRPIGDFIYSLANKGFKVFTGVFDDFYRSFNKISNQRFYFFGDMSIEQFANGIKSIFNEISSGGKNLDYWLYTAPKVFQVITRLMLSAKSIFGYFSGKGLQTTLKKLGGILTSLGNTLAKLVRPFKEALGSLFQQLATAKNLGFADIFKAVLASVAKAFTGFVKVIQDEFWPSIKASLVWVWNALSSFVQTIDWSAVWSGVVGIFKGLYDFIAGIDWSSVGSAISTTLSAIVNYVSSIDWKSVWSVIWSSLTAVGQFLADNVFPIFTNFFSWLVSWFTDSGKNQTLLNAITSVWTFVVDWSSAIINAIAPYISGFFGWIFSWFTDAEKNNRLLGAITSTWNFIIEWSKSIIGVITPYLSGFFTWLLSWFTDPSKRGQLWNGITTTWNVLIEWSKALISNITPYMSALWSWIYSWFSDPAKKAQMSGSLYTGWNSIITWANNLWNNVSPGLSTLYNNLISWLETQSPGLGQATDKLKVATTSWVGDALAQFKQNLPIMGQSLIDLKNTIVNEVPQISEAMGRLYKALFGDGSSGSEFANKITWFFNTVSSAIGTLVKQARILIEVFAIMVEATKAAFSGDFNTYIQKSMEFGAKIGEFNQTVADQWSQFSQLFSNQPQGGYATGGITQGGTVLVGEKGAELVDLPGGSRVWDHGQSMGRLSGGKQQNITITIKNEGTLAIDRKTIDEIAMQLQRKMNLQGNRFVLAN